MSTLSEIYGHCPVCGMQGTTAGFVCGHNPFTSPNPGSDSAPIQYSFADSRDAEIAKLRELCGEAAVQLDEYLDYERTEHICIVIGDVALAAKLRAASEGKKL